MSDEIYAIIAIQRRVYETLRNRHPELGDQDDFSPIFDSYEGRCAEVLRLLEVQEAELGTRQIECSPNKSQGLESFEH